MKPLLAASLLVLLLTQGTAFSFVEDHDEFSLELKGFSPELVNMVQVHLNRNEGRYPPPAPSKLKQAWYNLINNEVAEPLQPSGYSTIDTKIVPKHL